MNSPDGCTKAVYIQAKHITRQHNTTYHGACHRDEYEQHQHRPEYTDRRIIPPKEVSTPFYVQNMVQDEQQENADAKPFMHCLAY